MPPRLRATAQGIELLPPVPTSAAQAPAPILLCGALAFDHIGELTPADGAFLRPGPADAPPGSDLPRLNLKLDRLWQQLGGCALNVSYGLARCGVTARPLAMVGEDFGPREQALLDEWGISSAGLLATPGPSARAFVFTDPESGNQLTTFYPMSSPDLANPADRARILAHYQQQKSQASPTQAALLPAQESWQRLAATALADVPLRIWNPGQFVEHLSAQGAADLWAWAQLIFVNAHEWSVLSERLDQPPARLVVISDGAAPLLLMVPNAKPVHCPVPARSDDRPILDPTGCGDALLAGTLAALATAAPDTLVQGGAQAQDALLRAVAAGTGLAQRCLSQQGAIGYR